MLAEQKHTAFGQPPPSRDNATDPAKPRSAAARRQPRVGLVARLLRRNPVGSGWVPDTDAPEWAAVASPAARHRRQRLTALLVWGMALSVPLSVIALLVAVGGSAVVAVTGRTAVAPTADVGAAPPVANAQAEAEFALHAYLVNHGYTPLSLVHETSGDAFADCGGVVCEVHIFYVSYADGTNRPYQQAATVVIPPAGGSAVAISLAALDREVAGITERPTAESGIGWAQVYPDMSRFLPVGRFDEQLRRWVNAWMSDNIDELRVVAGDSAFVSAAVPIGPPYRPVAIAPTVLSVIGNPPVSEDQTTLNLYVSVEFHTTSAPLPCDIVWGFTQGVLPDMFDTDMCRVRPLPQRRDMAVVVTRNSPQVAWADAANVNIRETSPYGLGATALERYLTRDQLAPTTSADAPAATVSTQRPPAEEDTP